MLHKNIIKYIWIILIDNTLLECLKIVDHHFINGLFTLSAGLVETWKD